MRESLAPSAGTMERGANEGPRLTPRSLDSAIPSLTNRAAWRDAAIIWLAQHLFLLAFTIIGVRLLSPSATPVRMLVGWYSWDGAIYAGIARYGYIHQWQTAFYPALPALEHVLSLATGGETFLAGLIISNVAVFFTLGLLRVLVEREYGRAVARRAAWYLVAFPTAFFLAAPYSESLFLLFSVACFIALRREHWLAAGAWAAAAALTRPVGILLVAPMLAQYVSHRQWTALGAYVRERRAIARLIGGLALPIAALVGNFLALSALLGSLSPTTAEFATSWERSLAAPWTGYVRVAQALRNSPNAFQLSHIVLDSAATTGLVVLAVALWCRLPFPYVAYTWVSVALILMTPSHGWYALGSNMRFMLVLFPLFMQLGRWGEKPWVNILLLGCSLLLLALLTAVFVNGGWVA